LPGAWCHRAAGAAIVRVSALGHVRVEKDGRPLDSPELVVPRELLYYLPSHRDGR
jgi:hypothetical protein